MILTDGGGAKLGTRHAEVVEAIDSGGKGGIAGPVGSSAGGTVDAAPPV